MLGRFVARPLPRKMWNSLSDAIVAFLMNEYVLYEKYQQVLQEVGEIKLARAHSRIETEGIDNMVVRNFDLTNFIPLLYSQHDWNRWPKNWKRWNTKTTRTSSSRCSAVPSTRSSTSTLHGKPKSSKIS